MWQVASTTGWSVGYILWGISYQCLQLMLADAPRYKRATKPKTKQGSTSLHDFFRQRKSTPK
nr:MAG TPA: hypothetical protein [Caudoviricetes sp.]